MRDNTTSRVVLCADIGTTSLKAAFINIETAAAGRLTAFTREVYCAGAAANDALMWEGAFYRAVKTLLADLLAESPRARVEALCISGNGPTLVPVKGGGKAGWDPLPPLHWFSPSFTPETLPAAAKTSFFLPHAAYFRQNNPELYAKTSLFLSCQEWLSARLGAEPVTVLPTSYYRPYYYDDNQCAAFSLDSRKFPAFAPLGSIIGHVSVEAARNSGLSAGIPVIAGGPDFIMALLGSGAIAPGLVCDRAGSSEGINVCVSAKPDAAAARSLRVLPHAIEGLWNVSVVLPESGSIFDRYRLESGQQDVPYEVMLRRMIDSGSSIHPVLQEIVDGVRRALETLREAGYPVSEMRHSGGQSKSPAWNRLKARACGCVLLIPEISDAELAGDAAAVMLALGDAPNISSACQKIVV
ncbi:MAG: sugar kinase, partial [Spirochaetaceae bacterium]|nr:sugar kinase [Spirochaetaceae bacterium]